ncbi:MAG: RdgB/HAM1 family non-canonical purine NTP pyrophosphatase [Bacteroidetes bacterium]|nr:RdgB/HAM1 family non-canonical purine NTP pyrophosphatase [Bacteroidota bacterium]
MRLVLATNNPHKVKEIRKILPESFELLDLKQAGVTEELPETSGTIEGNAIQKALRVWELTGMQCVADDSGLEVEVLGGKPGVDSAHFAGLPRNDARNVIFLLDQLEGVQNRRAGFRTVLAYVQNGEVFTFEGTVQGVISNAQRGTGGFGYDPVFVPEGYEKSFAELPAEVKNSISHRANALKLFHDFIVKR